MAKRKQIPCGLWWFGSEAVDHFKCDNGRPVHVCVNRKVAHTGPHKCFCGETLANHSSAAERRVLRANAQPVDWYAAYEATTPSVGG